MPRLKSDHNGRYVLVGHDPVPEPDLDTWARSLESNRRVAETTVGQYWVSTVFLGLDHGWSGGQPVLFETMVRDRDNDTWLDIQNRYCTWDEAEAGHAKVVAEIEALVNKNKKNNRIRMIDV